MRVGSISRWEYVMYMFTPLPTVQSHAHSKALGQSFGGLDFNKCWPKSMSSTYRQNRLLKLNTFLVEKYGGFREIGIYWFQWIYWRLAILNLWVPFHWVELVSSLYPYLFDTKISMESRGKLWNKEKTNVKIRNKVQDPAVLQLLWDFAVCVKGLLQLTVSLLFWHFIIFGAALMVIEFGISANSQYYSLLIFQIVHDYLKSQLPFIYTVYIYHFFCPRFPAQNWGCGWSFQVQTATSHQPFHPGLCVPLSRACLSRQVDSTIIV